MMFKLTVQQIGYFQLDNLVRNRVPFFLLNLDADFSHFYSELIYQRHLEAQLVATTAARLWADLEARGIEKASAIVVVCTSGKASLQIYNALEKKGFSNVFWVSGGFQSLTKDRC